VKKMAKKREKWETLIGIGGIWMNEWRKWMRSNVHAMNEKGFVEWMNQRIGFDISHSLFSSSCCLFSGGAGNNQTSFYFSTYTTS
jgi:hypothetical protein